MIAYRDLSPTGEATAGLLARREYGLPVPPANIREAMAWAAIDRARAFAPAGWTVTTATGEEVTI